MTQNPKLRGLITTLLIWVAPVLTCTLRADEPFDYFGNSWTIIGLKDYAHGTRITPDNQLIIHDSNGKPSRVLIRFGQQLTPLTRRQVKILMDGWLPVVSITAEDSQVMYEFTLWATPLPSVKVWQKAFDWPIDGENFLNWILVKVTNTGQTEADAKLKVERSKPSSTTYKTFTRSLAPGENAETVISIPFSPLKKESDFAMEDAKLWLDRTVQYWRGFMERATQIKVPCDKATRALLASHVYQLIANDRVEVVFRPNQKKHWDFSAVVKLYRQHAVPIIEKNHEIIYETTVAKSRAMAPGLSNRSRQSRVGGGVLVWSGYSWAVWLGRKVTMEGWPFSFTAQYCRRQGIVTDTYEEFKVK